METESPSSPVNNTAKYDGEEISMIEILNVFLRHRRIIVLLPILAAVIVGAMTFLQPRTYSASASFMPQIPEGRAGSSAAALARSFGVNIGGGERPGASPQFYADLLKTREVLRKAVETEYRFGVAEGAERQATLVEIYEVEETPFTPGWRKGVQHLQDKLTVGVGRETGVIQIAVSAISPQLAEQILERLLELVNDFNLDSRQSQAQEEARFISARMEEVHKELLKAKARLQIFLQTNRQFQNSPELLFDHDDLQREVAMRQEIYTTLVQAREQARIDAVRDTPLLTVINSAQGSAVPEGRGTVRRAIFAFIVVFLMAITGAFLWELLRRNRREEGGDYREFQQLMREAKKDLYSPSRWFLPHGRKGDSPNTG